MIITKLPSITLSSRSEMVLWERYVAPCEKSSSESLGPTVFSGRCNLTGDRLQHAAYLLPPDSYAVICGDLYCFLLGLICKFFT